MSNETIATYKLGGKTYEIDYLGCAVDAQWGDFAVYCNDVQLAEFSIPESMLSTEELIRLARQAVALDEAAEVVGS